MLRAGEAALRFPVRILGALEIVLHAETLRARDLADHLDAPGRAVLLRRLVREGFLRPDPT